MNQAFKIDYMGREIEIRFIQEDQWIILIDGDSEAVGPEEGYTKKAQALADAVEYVDYLNGLENGDSEPHEPEDTGKDNWRIDGQGS